MYTSHSEFLTDGACTKDRALSVSVPSADDERAAAAAGCKNLMLYEQTGAVKTIWLRCNNRKTRINSSRLAAWPLHRDQIERLKNIYQEVIKPVSYNRRMVNIKVLIQEESGSLYLYTYDRNVVIFPSFSVRLFSFLSVPFRLYCFWLYWERKKGKDDFQSVPTYSLSILIRRMEKCGQVSYLKR